MKLGPWANPEGKHIRRGGKDAEHTSCPEPPALTGFQTAQLLVRTSRSPRQLSPAEPGRGRGPAQLLSGFWLSVAQQGFQTCPQACPLYLT